MDALKSNAGGAMGLQRASQQVGLMSTNQVLAYAAQMSPKDAASTLSPNFVLEFARARSQQIDSWLSNQLATIKQSGNETEAVNKVLTEVARYHALDGIKSEQHQGMKDVLDAAINSLPANSAARQTLTSLRDDDLSLFNIGKENKPDLEVNKGELEAMKTNLENLLKTVDRGAQEAQLYVNQKIGEKGEVMQLAAMLLQQMHDTVKGILQRI